METLSNYKIIDSSYIRTIDNEEFNLNKIDSNKNDKVSYFNLDSIRDKQFIIDPVKLIDVFSAKGVSVNRDSFIPYDLDYDTISPFKTEAKVKDRSGQRIEKAIAETIELLKEDPVRVGYVSKAENFIKSNLESRKGDFFGNYIMELSRKLHCNEKLFADFIEIIGNLDYKKANPFNYSIICQGISYNNPVIQENSIAAIEKWEDPENITFLEKYHFLNDDLTAYANEVAGYLGDI